MATLRDAETASIESLFAAWTQAGDYDESRRIGDQIVALGTPAAEALVAMLADEARRSDATELLSRNFGDVAVAPLLARLPKSEGAFRAAIVEVLTDLVQVWRDRPDGPTVCRALLPLVWSAADDDSGRRAAQALADGAPASRSIAKDLGEVWARGAPGEAERAACILMGLGADAAPAASIILAAALDGLPTARHGEDSEVRVRSRFDFAMGILSAGGSGDPSILDALRKLLARGVNPVVHGCVASGLVGWGDAGAAAAPDLLRILRECTWTDAPEDEETRLAAWSVADALRAMPCVQDALWEEIQQAYARGDTWTRDRDVVSRFARHPGLADRLAALAPTLPPEVGGLLQCEFFQRDVYARTRVALTPAMLRHPLPWARHGALEAWTVADERRPLPACAADLLADPDAAVRARAAWVLALHGGATADAIRDAALSVIRPDAAGVFDAPRWARIEAHHALGLDAGNDPVALKGIVMALDSDPDHDVRLAAASALATGDSEIVGDHPAAVAWLRDWADPERGNHVLAACAGALLRIRGGADALADAIRAHRWDESPAALEGACSVAMQCGPRAAPLRAFFARRRASAEGWDAVSIDRALAAIDADPELIARTWDVGEPAVRRLLGLGAAGQRALVVLASRTQHLAEIAPFLEDVALADAVRKAAHAAPPDPRANELRLGATRLAYMLPAQEAAAIWTAALDDAARVDAAPEDAMGLRIAVAESAAALERRSPGAVPLDLVGRLLAAERPTAPASRLAGLVGPRATTLAPVLRGLRDGDDHSAALCATVALWRVTRSADDVLPAVERLLPEVVDYASFYGMPDGDSWPDAVAGLAEMPLGRSHLAALLAAVRRGGPGRGGLVPLLERFGADGAPAVPDLRRMLWEIQTEGDRVYVGPSANEPAARALGAIGPAAREALPDLRRWIIERGDPDGIGREAVRRIEFGPK